MEDGTLEELYVERASLTRYVGNIYKGRVVNVEPAIQAAFVDFGVGKNGFLHISDLHPRYFAGKNAIETEEIGKRRSLRERRPIQGCLHKGDEVVVQVTKEGINTKGPTLSTYLALPGKYLVMMPWMEKSGVSHKIEDEQERERLRKIFEQSNPPKDIGFIIRTAAQGSSKRDIQNDMRYLRRLWAAIEKRIAEHQGACGAVSGVGPCHQDFAGHCQQRHKQDSVRFGEYGAADSGFSVDCVAATETACCVSMTARSRCFTSTKLSRRLRRCTRGRCR